MHAQVKNRPGNGLAKETAIVATYKSHPETEFSIRKLQLSGFDVKKLSVVGRDYHTNEKVVGYYNTGECVGYWGKSGLFWNGVWGTSFGSAFFWIPETGPLVVAGPLVGLVVGALKKIPLVEGLSALGAGLLSLGIPEESILRYETAIKSDKFVLIVHCSMQETAHAREVISRSPAETLEQHQPIPNSTEIPL